MKVTKMPANQEYLFWDPESLQEYDQWIELESEIKRSSMSKHSPVVNLAKAISTIRNRLILKNKRF